MIVSDSQPDTYLQIQAILYREGFRKQIIMKSVNKVYG